MTGLCAASFAKFGAIEATTSPGSTGPSELMTDRLRRRLALVGCPEVAVAHTTAAASSVVTGSE